MPEVGWIDLATAAFSGGIVVKALDVGYQEFKRRTEAGRSAKQFVDEHLDPLLKASDELVGKINVLARRDFKRVGSLDPEVPDEIGKELASALYLFSKLWCRVEILRRQSLYVRLARDKRGKELLQLLDCLESPRIRLVDRTEQQAIGEAMVEREQGKMDCIAFVRFVERWKKEAEFRAWLSPASKVLSRTAHTEERQRILQYGVVVQLLVDTLDPKHEVTRDRPSYPNKLTRKTRRSIQHRVIACYASGVANRAKYVGGGSGKAK